MRSVYTFVRTVCALIYPFSAQTTTGQSGSVNFNNQLEELEIVWQKDNMNDASQLDNVKSLSGGERSFATLSLLLALGESIER